MAFKTRADDKGDFVDHPTGSFPAACVRIIDYGTRQTNFGDKRQVIFGFETSERQPNGEPFILQKWMTLSLNKKANLRKMLESWRGKAYADGDDIDVGNVIGKPCMVSVTEYTRNDNSTGVGLDSVTRMPKGMTAYQPTSPLVVWDFDAPDFDALYLLHDKFQEKILDCPEGRKALGKPEPQTAQQRTDNAMLDQADADEERMGELIPAGAGEPDFDDDIPFAPKPSLY